MNNKLHKQLSQITDYDPQTRMQKQMMWQQSYNKRQGFLVELENEIFEKGLVGKEKSKYYSDSVVNYDKSNMKVF